jgi:hypothetical protein
MRPVLAVLLVLCLLVAGVVGLAVHCGPSPLRKAYGAYDAQVEKALAGEADAWARLLKLFGERVGGGDVSQEKFDSFVTKEALPLYEKVERDLAAAAPTLEALKPAHEALTKSVAARAAFARHVAANLEVFRADPAMEELAAREAEAQQAAGDYDQWVHADQMRVADSRFTELRGIRDAFSDRVEKFKEGKLARTDLEDFLRKDAIQRAKKLHATRFDDDQPSQTLRKAVVGFEQWFEAFAAALPTIERQFRFAGEADRLAREGDDLRAKFKAEMKAVRSKM